MTNTRLMFFIGSHTNIFLVWDHSKNYVTNSLPTKSITIYKLSAETRIVVSLTIAEGIRFLVRAYAKAFPVTKEEEVAIFHYGSFNVNSGIRASSILATHSVSNSNSSK